MYTATQVSKDKTSFSSNTHYLWNISSCLKKHRQNLRSLYQNGMPFRDPSLRTQKTTPTLIPAPLLNDQQQLLISFWLQVLSHFSCLKFRVIFLNVPYFFSSSSLCPWDILFSSLRCPSPSDLNLICYLTRLEILISALLLNPRPELHLC